MKLYHGSNSTIEKPDLSFSKRHNMDFGLGFYTTTSYEQAEQFTDFVKRRNKNVGEKIVSIYNFNIDGFKELKIKNFSDDHRGWLDYVHSNRREFQDILPDYDVVIGPVADRRCD